MKIVRTTALFLAMISLFFLMACGAPEAAKTDATVTPKEEVAQSDAGTDAQAASEPIKIGYMNGLTGDIALWGQCGLNAITMEAEKINAAGGVLGRMIEIVPVDGRGDPVDSINAFKKAVTEQGIICAVGTGMSSTQIPLAPVADQLKIPIVSTGASNPKVTVSEDGVLHPYSFRVCFTDPYQGQVLAAFAVNELKMKTAAVLTDIGSDYSVGLTKFFSDAFKALGGEIVLEVQGRAGDNDFRAQLSSIAEVNPDIIFVPWVYKDVALIARQARELGIKAPLFGGDAWDSKELMSLAGPELEGCYFTSQPSFSRPNTKPFYDEYVAKFNIVPETEALLAHDALYWIVDCFNKTGEINSESLRATLETTTSFEGLLGNMAIDPATHNPIKQVTVNTIKNSEVIFVGEFLP